MQTTDLQDAAPEASPQESASTPICSTEGFDASDSPIPEPEVSAQEPQPLEPSKELASLQADLEKFRDLALRSQADFENFRKRTAREREEAVRYANASLIEDLLPILDNFELGMAAASNDPAATPILQGLSIVQKQFGDFLRAQGVQPVDATPGDLFDPKVHEALGQENSEEIPEGAITRQTRRGWKLRDRLLRAAAVYVSRGPGEKATSSGE